MKNEQIRGEKPIDKRAKAAEFLDTESLGYKEYKCGQCGWVHAAVPAQALLANSSTDKELRDFLHCFNCKAPTTCFLPAKPADAPDGCTLQPVYVQGAWGEN
jgi:hypothetical protein